MTATEELYPLAIVTIPGTVEGRERRILASEIAPGLAVHQTELTSGPDFTAWTLTHLPTMKTLWVSFPDEAIAVAVGAAAAELGDWRCATPELVAAWRSLLEQIAGRSLETGERLWA